LQQVGSSFAGVLFGESFDALTTLQHLHPQTKLVLVVPAGSDIKTRHGIDVIEDVKGLLAERFDARSGTFYLLRPDQHVAMRARFLDPHAVREALARATCTLNETQSA
jgi:3-(3-hydroxy-phenyl)propionate hydroxylase